MCVKPLFLQQQRKNKVLGLKKAERVDSKVKLRAGGKTEIEESNTAELLFIAA